MTIVYLLAVAFFILTLKKPIWALGLILALLPTYLIRFTLFGLPTTLLELLLVVFLFATLTRLNIKDLRTIKNLGQINWAAGLFILAGVIATVVSPEPTKALGELKAFVVEPVLFFYACCLLIKTAEDKKIILRLIFTSATLVSVFGLIQYLTLINLPIRFWGTGTEIERISSVFDYPNALALYLGPILVLFLTLWLKRFRLYSKPWVQPLGLILIAGALLLTFSRGAWFAVILLGLVLVLKKYSWKKVLPPLVLATIILLLIAPIRQRILLGLTDPASLARVDLITVGVNKIIQSPFLGNGLYGFRTTLEQAHFSGEILNYPHNIFLNFWLELGLLGLVAFGWIIFLCSEQYKKNPARYASPGDAGGPSLIKFSAGMFLLTLLIHGLVDVPYFKNDLAILFWFVIALFYV